MMNNILHSKTARTVLLILTIIAAAVCTILLQYHKWKFSPDFVFFLFTFVTAGITATGVSKLLVDLFGLGKKWLLTLISAAICLVFELVTLYIDFYTAPFSYLDQIPFYIKEQIFSYTVMYLGIFIVCVVFLRRYCDKKITKNETADTQ